MLMEARRLGTVQARDRCDLNHGRRSAEPTWMQSAQRIVVSHAPREAYAPLARSLLSRLGYRLMSPEEYEPLADAEDLLGPDVRIADERQLAEVPHDYRPTPIIVISGERGVSGMDPRIVGAVRRPAGMQELFRVIQQATEATPRATPRVPTHLPAHCHYDDRDWRVAILSLSEQGCLVRSAETLPLGASVELCFDLPRAEGLRVVAETGYQLLPDLGLLFDEVPAQTRQAIRRFVSFTLER